MRLLLLTVSTLVLFLPASALSITIHVPGDQATIQAGIDVAIAGDTVLVACGTYHEHGILMKGGVCLRSSTGSPGCVTIDGDSLDTVVYCVGTDSTTSIEGFTIVNGNAPSVGGAINCADSASPNISSCMFSANYAPYYGGAIFCVNSSSPSMNAPFMKLYSEASNCCAK